MIEIWLLHYFSWKMKVHPGDWFEPFDRLNYSEHFVLSCTRGWSLYIDCI